MTEPVFVSTAAGADDAVRRGNRRRARSAAVSTGAALVLAAVLVAAPWQGAPRKDSLVPAREGVVPTSDPTAASRARVRAPAVTAERSGAPRPAPPALAGAATSAPSARPISRQARPVPEVRTSSPITRGSSTIADGDLCRDDPVDAARGWCVRYTGPATARRGHPVSLTQQLCRLAAYPAAAIAFTSTREALLTVSGGSAQWQAGQGEGYRSPGRTVTVQPGACLTWSSTWDTRGTDGFLVTPGTYDVSAGVESSDLTTAVLAQLQVTD